MYIEKLAQQKTEQESRSFANSLCKKGIRKKGRKPSWDRFRVDRKINDEKL